MAFTVKGEYDRLVKHKAECEKKLKDKRMGFECGCACGYVTRIEYIPRKYNAEVHKWFDEEVHVYAIAGWDKEEKLVIVITENDVSKRYQDRSYKYWSKYGILESFPYKWLDID